MGCSCDESNIIEIPINDYFKSYENIIEMNEKINNKKINIHDNIYLVDVHSIPKYYGIIKDYLKKDSGKEEKKELNKKLYKYDLKENVIIFNSYDDCLNIAKDNNNKILIVNKDFINNMKIGENINKFVLLEEIKENIIKIKFQASNGYIFLEKISYGLYKFIEDNQIKNKEEDLFNPPTIIKK